MQETYLEEHNYGEFDESQERQFLIQILDEIPEKVVDETIRQILNGAEYNPDNIPPHDAYVKYRIEQEKNGIDTEGEYINFVNSKKSNLT